MSLFHKSLEQTDKRTNGLTDHWTDRPTTRRLELLGAAKNYEQKIIGNILIEKVVRF